MRRPSQPKAAVAVGGQISWIAALRDPMSPYHWKAVEAGLRITGVLPEPPTKRSKAQPEPEPATEPPSLRELRARAARFGIDADQLLGLGNFNSKHRR